MDKPDITVIILTYNEVKHIRRVIENAKAVAKRIVIVDSFSTDETIPIVHELNADIYQHSFSTQAQQFQWAMDNCNIDTGWILRLDADEYLMPELIAEIKTKLPGLPDSVTGIFFKRRVFFMNRWIRHGGYYPLKLLRLWRTGYAKIEQRWMDEHTYLVTGDAIDFSHDFIDDNLNNLSWWTAKHNSYSTREAIDILTTQTVQPGQLNEHDHLGGKQVNRKRWYKQNLYLRLPMFFRCFLYYQYRYWIKLGFLDGRQGLVFHFLQAFWYRLLVDAKIWQIQSIANKERKSISEVIEQEYHVQPVIDKVQEG